MPRSSTRTTVPTLLALAFASTTHAGTVIYSGRLSDAGQPAQGSYALRLTPYASRTGATRAGAPIQVPGVAVHDGRFQATVDLGGLTDSYDTLWLAVEVAGSGGTFSSLPGREQLATQATASACWDTAGNALAGTEFIGSTNDQPFEIHVNNDRTLRIDAAQSGAFVAPNVTTGAPNNLIQGSAGSVIAGGGGTESDAPVGNQIDSVSYGTIGGGLRNRIGNGSADVNNGDFGTVAGGVQNHAYGDSATVGGGYDNYATGFRAVVGGGIANAANNTDSVVGGGNANLAAGDQSVVAGGESNETNATWSSVGGGVNNAANAQGAVVSGGVLNIASGPTATVPGGYNNLASGISSYAAGVRAHAKYQGMYVWSDDSNPNPFNPARKNIDAGGLDNGWAPATNSYNVRATGGVWFISGMSGNNGVGVYVNPGAGAWSSTSSRAFKTAIEDIDTGAILSAVVDLPLSYWRYTTEVGQVRHLGPYSEDFAKAFSLGPDDRSITGVDADGVALAAIQGLNAKLREELGRRDEELLRLREDAAVLVARLERLERLEHAQDGASEAER